MSNNIIIPVGAGSKYNNDELRIALRSIEAYTNVDNIYIVTTLDIPWLKNVTIVPVEDSYKHNKDNNLITKIFTTLNQYPEIEDFVFWSDDQVIVNNIDLATFKNAYNDRGLDFFRNKDELTKWQKRVLNTLETIKWFKADTSVNWESHTPVKFNRSILQQAALHNVPSIFSNYTINTIFSFFNNIRKEDGVLQDSVKTTYESEFTGELNTSKPFIGYNDKAFSTGLREKLFDLFPNISKYEKLHIAGVNTLAIIAKNIKDYNTILNLTKNISYTPVVFPIDKVSSNSLNHIKDYSVIDISTDNITDSLSKSLEIAKYLSKQTIVIDGDTEYAQDYINTMLSEYNTFNGVIETENKAIFNTVELSAIVNNNKDKDYSYIVNQFIDRVKNIVLLKDN